MLIEKESLAQYFLLVTVALITLCFVLANHFDLIVYFAAYWIVIPVFLGFYYTIKAIEQKS
ncbi:MAG: hypothetical protein COT90_01935 [Candidatus Diapherotrites archaeon CG10_big_fil_rev_8_21_14_0_10_31_34]|nr:MAG: hypothetical protein COT90_01935 [Candidatus Diapherotrites archaeon CG10_big_fil_rev_8_21_14_0_10_31_34]